MPPIAEIIKGAKRKHPLARFLCACGQERTARATSVRRGLVSQCVACAKASAAKRGGVRRRLPEPERTHRERLSVYRLNAKAKGLSFELSPQEFVALLLAPCDYCGVAPGGGVDRVDSARGYVAGNCVSCCATCNYAKRELSRAEFVAWVARVHDHQSALQRDRPVLLRVVEQPDGCRSHQAGGDSQQVDLGLDPSGRARL